MCGLAATFKVLGGRGLAVTQEPWMTFHTEAMFLFLRLLQHLHFFFSPLVQLTDLLFGFLWCVVFFSLFCFGIHQSLADKKTRQRQRDRQTDRGQCKGLDY